jgi:hypothetical protein
MYQTSLRQYQAWSSHAAKQASVGIIQLTGSAKKHTGKSLPGKLQQAIQPHFLWLRENFGRVCSAFGWIDVTTKADHDLKVLKAQVPVDIRDRSKRLFDELQSVANVKGAKRRTLVSGEPLDISNSLLQPDFIKLFCAMRTKEERQMQDHQNSVVSFKNNSKQELAENEEAEVKACREEAEDALKQLVFRETELLERRPALSMYQNAELKNMSKKRAWVLDARNEKIKSIEAKYARLQQKKTEHERLAKKRKRARGKQDLSAQQKAAQKLANSQGHAHTA